ncbi:MAG: type II toxin-antitoxin system VapC family toxin [Lentisphaerae bacterium]|nr:type II toxin-antitoxin system VapC family toxin [Lentisphaerota bacterium]
MRFMLDTNTCVELIRERDDRILRRMKRRSPDALCVSSVTLSELEYGAAKSANPEKNRLALAEFMTPICVASYDDVVAPVYGRIRAELERGGTPIGPLDTMIAAHALALGLTVVTGNEREFRRVAGLKVQNWAK